jgi:hypothetical protein
MFESLNYGRFANNLRNRKLEECFPKWLQHRINAQKKNTSSLTEGHVKVIIIHRQAAQH